LATGTFIFPSGHGKQFRGLPGNIPGFPDTPGISGQLAVELGLEIFIGSGCNLGQRGKELIEGILRPRGLPSGLRPTGETLSVYPYLHKTIAPLLHPLTESGLAFSSSIVHDQNLHGQKTGAVTGNATKGMKQAPLNNRYSKGGLASGGGIINKKQKLTHLLLI
jgi:hypothetical protein